MFCCYIFLIIIEILRFLTIHHYKIMFPVEISMSMTTCGWGSHWFGASEISEISKFHDMSAAANLY